MALPKIPSYALPTAAELPDNRVQWTLNPQRAAVLVHDLQDYFLAAYGDDSPLRQQLINAVRRILDAAHTADVPVFYTAQPPKQDPQDRGLLTDFWGPGLMDYALAQIDAAIAPQYNDTVLTKWRYDAFERSDFRDQLAQAGRDQLVIVGVYAHIGCTTTAQSAFMKDIHPFVVADAMGDFSRTHHDHALQHVAWQSSQVVTTNYVLDHFSDAADQHTNGEGTHD